MKIRHSVPTKLHMLGFVCDCGKENKCIRHRRVKVLCACGRLYISHLDNLGNWTMRLLGKAQNEG